MKEQEISILDLLEFVILWILSVIELKLGIGCTAPALLVDCCVRLHQVGYFP